MAAIRVQFITNETYFKPSLLVLPIHRLSISSKEMKEGVKKMLDQGTFREL